jgi:hypothetical protein
VLIVCQEVQEGEGELWVGGPARACWVGSLANPPLPYVCVTFMLVTRQSGSVSTARPVFLSLFLSLSLTVRVCVYA